MVLRCGWAYLSCLVTIPHSDGAYVAQVYLHAAYSQLG